MTSPYSIYILVGLTYPNYKAENFATYIDSRLGLCFAKEDCFPRQYHENLPSVRGKDISNDTITLQRGRKNPKIIIDKYIVKLPSLYFHITGCDIILGNIFLQQFQLIIQNNLYHFLQFKTPCNHWITTPRLKRVFARKIPIPFTPHSQRGDLLPHTKSNRKDFDQPLLVFETLLLHKLDLCANIRQKLESLYVDNPLQFWDTNKIYATLELKDPNKIIRIRPMRHNELDLKEFQQQIKELLDLKLIRPKSPHSSPAFMIRNRNEIKRGKARMVVN